MCVCESPCACTSLAFASSGDCASLVCLMFSTIFLRKAWLLFSFLVISTSSMNQRHLGAKRKHTGESHRLHMYVRQLACWLYANVMCPPNSLFDVFELFIFLWLCEVWVMGQQVDHVRNNILRKERDEFFWRRRKNDMLRYWEYAACCVVPVSFKTSSVKTPLLESARAAKLKACGDWKLTLSKRVLFDVLSADGDVLQEALSGVGTALLHWVLGTQGEDGQVLQWQQQFDESQVQLLGKDLAHLVALVLQAGTGGMKTPMSTIVNLVKRRREGKLQVLLVRPAAFPLQNLDITKKIKKLNQETTKLYQTFLTATKYKQTKANLNLLYIIL